MEKFCYISRPPEFAGECCLLYRTLSQRGADRLVHSSDIHFWKSGRIGSLVFEGDCILGHEAAGIVLKCGEGVTQLAPGECSIIMYVSQQILTRKAR